MNEEYLSDIDVTLPDLHHGELTPAGGRRCGVPGGTQVVFRYMPDMPQVAERVWLKSTGKAIASYCGVRLYHGEDNSMPERITRLDGEDLTIAAYTAAYGNGGSDDAS